MKDKVDITGKTWQEVVSLVNCSKTTAKNALKRGYYVVDYKKTDLRPRSHRCGGLLQNGLVYF